MLETIDDIQQAVRDGFFDGLVEYGGVNVTHYERLILFCYQRTAMYEEVWTPFQRLSRGLLIEEGTGEIVARPFDKFFNWGEGGRTTSAPIRRVYNKLDGSLGIMYQYNGRWHINSKGAFRAGHFEQWGNGLDIAQMDGQYTYLVEVLWNPPVGTELRKQIVTRHDRERLALLAMRHNETGEYVDWFTLTDVAQRINIELVKPVVEFTAVDQIVTILPDLDAAKEGFVVEFEDDQRFKFKGKRFLALHRAVNGISWKTVGMAIALGEYEALAVAIPDEFLPEVEAYKAEFDTAVQAKLNEIDGAMAATDPAWTRKEFAQWANTHPKSLQKYLFAHLSGKTGNIRTMIIRDMGIKLPK